MRELRGARLVEVKRLGTDENSADMFTKCLTRQPFEKHRKVVMNLGVSVGDVRDAANSSVSSLADVDSREPSPALPDPKIKGWRVVDTMWTGRVKRKADRTVDKRKGRAVLRGDLHKMH